MTETLLARIVSISERSGDGMVDWVAKKQYSVAASEKGMQWVRPLWIAAGTVFLVLGVVGIPTPLLPTTPFVLLAAACYLRGSSWMHQWLTHNRCFGRYLLDYRAGAGIPRTGKIAAAGSLWLGIGGSAFFFIEHPGGRLLLAVVGVGVTVHLVRIKTKTSMTREPPLGDAGNRGDAA